MIRRATAAASSSSNAVSIKKAASAAAAVAKASSAYNVAAKAAAALVTAGRHAGVGDFSFELHWVCIILYQHPLDWFAGAGAVSIFSITSGTEYDHRELQGDGLAISTSLSERGNADEAIQTLLRIQDLTSSYLGISVEALVGLNLQLGLDGTSSVLAYNCMKILEKDIKGLKLIKRSNLIMSMHIIFLMPGLKLSKGLLSLSSVIWNQPKHSSKFAKTITALVMMLYHLENLFMPNGI